MTSQNNQTIAARRAALRRVRLALEARIQERLTYSCGATAYRPLEAQGCFTTTFAMNREFGVKLKDRGQAQEPAKTPD